MCASRSRMRVCSRESVYKFLIAKKKVSASVGDSAFFFFLKSLAMGLFNAAKERPFAAERRRRRGVRGRRRENTELRREAKTPKKKKTRQVQKKKRRATLTRTKSVLSLNAHFLSFLLKLFRFFPFTSSVRASF